MFWSSSVLLRFFPSTYQGESIAWTTSRRICKNVRHFSMFSLAKRTLRYMVQCHQFYYSNTAKILRNKEWKSTFTKFYLRWVQNFQHHGTVEIEQGVERPSRTSEDVERVSRYFNWYWRSSVRIDKADSGILRAQFTEFFETGSIYYLKDFEFFRNSKKVNMNQANLL